MPNFEILFFEMLNHFLHFSYLIGKTMPKLLVIYGIEDGLYDLDDKYENLRLSRPKNYYQHGKKAPKCP